jgi:hypothetical protein
VTCMGWTPTYDKNGARTDAGDPNITTHGFKCGTCGKTWSVSIQYGDTKIFPHDGAPK